MAKQKSELDKAWAVALATKKEFSAVAMASDGVIHSGALDASWATLSTDMGLLREALASLRSNLGSFGSDFVMKDPKQVRWEWKGNDAGLQTGCQNFAKHLGAPNSEV